VELGATSPAVHAGLLGRDVAELAHQHAVAVVRQPDAARAIPTKTSCMAAHIRARKLVSRSYSRRTTACWSASGRPSPTTAAYVAGAAQKVRPRTFGNAADGLLEAWNGAEWRSFREAVLRYDYPFCHECNHALCDVVSGGEEFAQDCHLGTVPCGACLWPTGLFQCLR
jgi:hypothetical protein